MTAEKPTDDESAPEPSTQRLLDDWRAKERRSRKAARMESVAEGVADAATASAASATTAAAAAERSVSAAEETLAAARKSLDVARETAATAELAAEEAEATVDAAEADIVRSSEARRHADQTEGAARARYHERERVVRDRRDED